MFNRSRGGGGGVTNDPPALPSGVCQRLLHGVAAVHWQELQGATAGLADRGGEGGAVAGTGQHSRGSQEVHRSQDGSQILLRPASQIG